jgi:hypothetical protein
MAKTEMICPFTNELCRECALYRGRHYYLCFCEKYRGHLDESEVASGENVSSRFQSISSNTFKIPQVISASAIDPFAKTLKDI